MRVSVVVMLAAFAGAAMAAEPGAPGSPVVEDVKKLRVNLEFPGQLDREALVILEFDVLANGRAANIKLVDEGFHEKRFVDEAMRAIRTSRWKPRTVNGKPVDSLGLRQAFKFSIAGQKPGITQEFLDEARKVEDLLRKGEIAAGEAHAQWMLANVLKLNYEYAVLEAELAQTYVLMGRPGEAINKLWSATRSSEGWPDFLQLLDEPPANKASNYLLDSRTVVGLLGMRMELMATRGMALEAVQTYYEIAGLDALPPDDRLTRLADSLAAQIRGNGNLTASILIGVGGAWRQFLSRRRFTLENVQPGIEGMKLVCEAGSREINYQPGEAWTVPGDWGLCLVRVRASPGTTLDFVELGDASN